MKKHIFSAILGMTLATTAWADGQHWTATWATATEYTGESDMPQSGTLTNKSIRQTVRVSIGGECVRLHLSNEYSREPVEIKSIYIADVDLSGVNQGNNSPVLDRSRVAVADIPKIGMEIERRTARYLRFDGKKSITIPPGETAVSDETEYSLRPSQLLSITITYGSTPVNATSHRGSRTTSYIIGGAATPKTDFSQCERTDHWYNIATLDVKGERRAIAVLGNSITDGRGTTTNLQDRWTDIMSETLLANPQTSDIAVLNLGIGGNSVYYGGLSDPAVKRFDRDILGQPGVDAIIVFEGINDLGGTDGDAEQRAAKLIECYKEFITKAHARGLKIYGATITPFRRSFYDNNDFFREAARQTVNRWIRENAAAKPGAPTFDSIIDFDKIVRDPANPDCLQEQYQSDWLHLNPAGYKALGEYAAEVMGISR